MTDESPDIDVFDEAEDAVPVPDGNWLSLAPIGLLSVESADRLLRRRPAQVIAIIGERNGGKTTLVTEIYDRFLHGGFGGFEFCESLSLVGFEEKSFQARAASGGEQPDTGRTSVRDGLRFFHLALSSGATTTRRDILITERAGESYRELRDDPAKAGSLVELGKACTIVLILDGARVLDKLRRAEAFASVRNIARAVGEAKKLQDAVQLQLVTTKFDLLQGDDAAAAVTALSQFENSFAEANKEKFGAVTTFRTAARDPNGLIEAAWGVAPLLSAWLTPVETPFQEDAGLPDLTNEFDRLALRRAS